MVEKADEHTWGIWTPAGGRPVAAYVRYNEHHRGYMVYNATTGRSLTAKAHRTVESVLAHEPFVANDKEPVRAEYVGERNNPDDPVKHDARKEPAA